MAPIRTAVPSCNMRREVSEQHADKKRGVDRDTARGRDRVGVHFSVAGAIEPTETGAARTRFVRGETT